MTSKQISALIDEALTIKERLAEIQAILIQEHEKTAEKKFFNAEGTGYCTYVEGAFPMVKDMTEIERIFNEVLHQPLPLKEGTPRRPSIRIDKIKSAK